ncbi:MAG: c-type cytochrome [Saprospiraceae bacterium]|nr:c-type cytochrome [Saprospiraceae bacterium]
MRFLLLTALMVALTIACGSSEGGNNESSSSAKKTAAVDPPNGAELFKTYCIQCHGLYGDLQINGAKDLSKSELTLEERITMIENGKNLMTPFKGMLTPEQIKAVAQYTFELKSK